jgi:hypothetical protein
LYRELKKLNSPKTNVPIKKWACELNRTFSKEEIQMARNFTKFVRNYHIPKKFKKKVVSKMAAKVTVGQSLTS